MTRKIIALLLCVMMIMSLSSCDLKDRLLNQNDDTTDNSSETESQENSSDTTTQKDPSTDSNKPSGGDQQDQPLPDVDPVTVKLTADTAGIKILGERMLTSEEEQINCDWTCSGIEFVLDSLGGNISFAAGSDKPCYFRAYINGEEWKNGINPYYPVSGDSTITLKKVPAGKLTVRLIKVTGHTLARAQLYSMTYYGTLSETAPADNDLYIEYVGDSISCGWGVVGDHDGNYNSQDGSLAYPYMLSQRLNADYSVTALSGQGLIYCGANMQNLYNGYLMSSPLRDSSVQYDFERKADVVVINIGTNDYSKRGTNGIDAESFATAYKSFINVIREKNGANCKIVCLYNTMNDTFAKSIVAACYELGGISAGIYTFEMDRAASGHPTIAENRDYTDALEEFMKDVIAGNIENPFLDSEETGDGMSAGVSQFQPMPNDR